MELLRCVPFQEFCPTQDDPGSNRHSERPESVRDFVQLPSDFLLF